MCDPVTLTVLTVASTAATFIGQKQAADAQEAANQQSRNLVIQNQRLQIRALQNQEDEDSRQAGEALRDNAQAADAAAATARVAAGESGVSGLSIDALLGDIVRQESENRFDIQSTQDFRQRQRELDREGVGITATSQVNQLPLVNEPDPFAAILTAASSSFGNFSGGGGDISSGNTFDPAKQPPPTKPIRF